MADLTSPAESGSTSDALVVSFRLGLVGTADQPGMPARDPEPDDLRSLRAWLRDDSHVGQHAIAQPVDKVLDPDQMGIVGDVLQFVADKGLDAAALVVAILAWRDSRPASLQQKVTLIRNGERLEITGNPATIERIVQLFEDEGK
ncbi:effector-associated constant component EACC1 [Micromonospora sp. DT41]|uniref:effector-associated constant component EACC1 n=1 Tax=Micromonospora sp. DT41 TaxID=3393437 RepID=UPI003CF8E379